MVQSKATTIDAWLDERPADTRPVFLRLRDLCRSELPDWEERMQWGMPGYGPPGEANVVSFNDLKRHFAFYAGETAITRFADHLAGLDCGKGCIRYRNATQIDFDLLADMLRHIRARDTTMC